MFISKSAKLFAQMICFFLIIAGMYIFADHFGFVAYVRDATMLAFFEVANFFNSLYTEFDTAPHKVAGVAIILMMLGLLGIILLSRFFHLENTSKQ